HWAQASSEAPGHAVELPGPIRLPESKQDGRVHHRRTLPASWYGPTQADPGRRQAAHGARRPEPGALQPLPARVLRWTAATHRVRPGPGAASEAHRGLPTGL